MVAERGSNPRFQCHYAVLENPLDVGENTVTWLLDTGASSHMSSERSIFQEDYKEDCSIVVGGNGLTNKASRRKDIELSVGVFQSNLLLTNVLFVPDLISSIISIPILTKEGYKVEFSGKSCIIKKGETVLIKSQLSKGHYFLHSSSQKSFLNNETIFDNMDIKRHDSLNEKDEIYPGTLTEPNDWKDVKQMPMKEKEIWIKAMYKEREILETAQAWRPLNEQENTIGVNKVLPTRWIYKIKYNEHNIIASVRARLVIKGCFQKPGKEFAETFAPVVNHATIRVLLTLAGKNEWSTKHCDINSAFLYGELNENLYIETPSGPWENNRNGSILLLTKAMYGLRQAARAWNDRIHNTLSKLGLVRSNGDPCLYYKKQDQGLILLIIHVDDLLMTYNDITLMNEVMIGLQKEYQLKDLGEVNTYLGINVVKRNGNFIIHQAPKIVKLVESMGLAECHGPSTPMVSGFNREQLSNDSKSLPNNERYQEILGSLMYLSNVSRPDITISTNILGRTVSKPTYGHWEAMKRIVKYLKDTVDFGLNLDPQDQLEFKVYCDSDWGGDQHDRKSTSGSAFFLGRSLIGWFSRKQRCTALSSAEAEYVSLSCALQEVTWINRLLTDICQEHQLPIKVYSDSQSCIGMAQSTGMSGRAKHIEMKYHYSMDLLNKKIITLEYCNTKEMTADIFTKPLEKFSFEKHRQAMGLGKF